MHGDQRRDRRQCVDEAFALLILNASHHAETTQDPFLLHLQGATAHCVARHLPGHLRARTQAFSAFPAIHRNGAIPSATPAGMQMCLISVKSARAS